MFSVFETPRSEIRRETKNPTVVIGPWAFRMSERSAPQNCHGSWAYYGQGDDANLDGYELIHC